LKVGDVEVQLREAATVARIGASELFAARSRVRHTVDDAHAAGFEVGEDLSVAYYSTGGIGADAAALHALAEELADDIHERARELVGLDQQVAGKISAALAGIDSVGVDEGSAAAGSDQPATERQGVQLVDWKQSPDPVPGLGPTAQDIQEAVKNLPRGTRPSFLEVRTEEDLRKFWEWISTGASEYSSPKPYRDGNGIERRLSDGTIVRIGQSNEWGSTMDISLPNDKHLKLHVNPGRGGELNFARSTGQSAVPIEPGAPAERAPTQPPLGRPGPPRTAKPSTPILGPTPPESIPRPIYPPHRHHGPPILGKDELPDLPEFDPG
jgi:hypothetical protein